MSGKVKVLISIVTFLAVSGAVMAGAFYKYGMGPEKHAEHIVNEIDETLSLEQHQLDYLTKLKNELLRMHRDLHDNKSNHMDKVMSLIKESTFDKTTALDLVDQKTRYINDSAPAIVAALGDFYDSLTTEQQDLLRQKIADHKKHHHFNGSH